MKILIRRMQENKGTIAFVDRRLESATLRIGRGTDQDLEIADPRVALAHAEITPVPAGGFRIDAKSTSGVWVNGGTCAVGDLTFEDRVDLGRFRLTLLRPADDSDLAVLVEERPASDVAQNRPEISCTRLDQTRLSRRGLAWAGFVVVLLAMLFLPLLLRFGGDAAKAAVPRSVSPILPTHAAWNSGPLSSAHAYFETDCAACHVKPFQRVGNAACLACHDTLRHHVPEPAMAALHDFSTAACTDCHREHNGPDGTVVRLASLCTDCHANLQARFPESTMAAATSFGSNHPPFSPRLARYDAATRSFSSAPASQGLGAPLQEDNGLVFPHDLHLDAKGIDAPEGTRALVCANCHEPDRGAVGFRAVSMERHCADCHRLEFDPDDPARVVPHGKPAEVAAVLRDHFAAKALDGQTRRPGSLPASPERRRPGPARTREDREFMARWTASQGDQIVREVFAGRLCRYCHVVQRTPDPKLPWRIAPVALQEHALEAAAFTHSPHADSACVDCHEAQVSKTSHDVLLPDIDNCRACHGDLGSGSQVASACVDCHGYHVDGGVIWDPSATQRKKALRARHPRLLPLPRGTS